MPYIDERDREMFTPEPMPWTGPGQLNFAITKMAEDYLATTGWVDPQSGKFDPRYTDLNEVIGVLECVKQEFYRRVVVPYEDRKMAENGDVYGHSSSANSAAVDQ